MFLLDVGLLVLRNVGLLMLRDVKNVHGCWMLVECWAAASAAECGLLNVGLLVLLDVGLNCPFLHQWPGIFRVKFDDMSSLVPMRYEDMTISWPSALARVCFVHVVFRKVGLHLPLLDALHYLHLVELWPASRVPLLLSQASSATPHMRFEGLAKLQALDYNTWCVVCASTI